MDHRIPLSTLLSHLLVAFTIEFDNEAERQMPHRTTRHAAKAGSLHAPWLVSMVMWLNCMQFLGEEGIPVRELERRARTPTNLPGMKRWGYVIVAPDPADRRPRPPRSAWLVRPTAAGRNAQEVWRPLFGVIEQRWQKRFGKAPMQRLRESLWAVAVQFDVELPDCLPILGYGLFSRGPKHQWQVFNPGGDSRLPVAALLSKVLLALAIDFEAESDLSLAISANLMRVLGEEATPVRELPRLTGVSKEAIATALSFLTKLGYAVVEAGESRSRTKVAHLTLKGRKAKDNDKSRPLLDDIEKRWQARFGERTVRSLREALEPLVDEPAEKDSPLLRGMEPYPDGWRASLPAPTTLPHYPMILHRGGFPDGS